VIQLRHRQPSLWHSGLAKDIEDLWEPWMKEVNQLLEDAALVESVYDAQALRRDIAAISPHSDEGPSFPSHRVRFVGQPEVMARIGSAGITSGLLVIQELVGSNRWTCPSTLAELGQVKLPPK
jgi:hypothetical protein